MLCIWRVERRCRQEKPTGALLPHGSLLKEFYAHKRTRPSFRSPEDTPSIFSPTVPRVLSNICWSRSNLPTVPVARHKLSKRSPFQHLCQSCDRSKLLAYPILDQGNRSVGQNVFNHHRLSGKPSPYISQPYRLVTSHLAVRTEPGIARLMMIGPSAC